MEFENKENITKGILGAAGGALIGGALCFLMLRLDIISSLPAALASYCSLGGYELLGKKLSKKGIVFACIFSLLALILAWLLDLSFILAEAWDYEYSGFEIFPYITLFISEGYFTENIYYEFIWLIFFAALGIYGKIRTAVQLNKEEQKFVPKKPKIETVWKIDASKIEEAVKNQNLQPFNESYSDSKKEISEQKLSTSSKKSDKIDELEKNLFK